MLIIGSSALRTLAATAIASFCLFVKPAQAVVEIRPVELVAGDNHATYEDRDGFRGLIDWSVKGTPQLFEQNFWINRCLIRCDSSGWVPVVSGNNAGDRYTISPTDNTFDVKHFLGGSLPVTVEVFYLLNSSSTYDDGELTEVVTITSRAPISFSVQFATYNDFELGNTTSDYAFSPFKSRVVQENRNGAATLLTARTDRSPTSLAIEAHDSSHNSGILYLLNAPECYGSSEICDGRFGNPISGDVSWAWFWNLNLEPGQAVQFTNRYRFNEVPEPRSATLLGIGLLGAIFAAVFSRSLGVDPEGETAADF